MMHFRPRINQTTPKPKIGYRQHAADDNPDPGGSEGTRAFEGERTSSGLPDRGKSLPMAEVRKPPAALSKSAPPCVGRRPLPQRESGARDLSSFAPGLSKTLSETLDALQLLMDDFSHRSAGVVPSFRSLHSLEIEAAEAIPVRLECGPTSRRLTVSLLGDSRDSLLDDFSPKSLLGDSLRGDSLLGNSLPESPLLEDPSAKGGAPSADGTSVGVDGSIESDEQGGSQPREDDEPPDALAALCAAYLNAQRKEGSVKFVPGMETGVLHCEASPGDDVSVLTLETHFRRMSLKLCQRLQRRRALPAVSEGGRASLGQQLSLASHQVREPTVPSWVLEEAGVVDPGRRGPSHPRLPALHRTVDRYTKAGDDAAAIDAAKGALAAAADDDTPAATELARVCLATLWVLARRGDGNKDRIASSPGALDAVASATRVHSARSADVPRAGVGLLGSLSVPPRLRGSVARRGGAAVLDALRSRPDDAALRAAALGALKALSFDDDGRSELRARGAPPVVSRAMARHAGDPVVQSEGCVALGNAAVGGADGFVVAVGEGEVDAVVRGIANHPESLDVHEAACFTLVILASAAENVDLIRRNGMTREALELAFQKHPDDVGIYILHLMSRLRLFSMT